MHSSTAAAVVKEAGPTAVSDDAELLVVWVLEPSSLHATMPFSVAEAGESGASPGPPRPRSGSFAKGRHPARVVVRIGDRGRVLEEERRAAGAERVFTRADVPSGGRALSLGPSRSTRLEPKAA